MKARTKLEKEVEGLSSKLKKPSPSLFKWAYNNVPNNYFYFNKYSGWCTECGKTFKLENMNIKPHQHLVICPECKSKLRLMQSRKLKDEQFWYFQTLQVVKDFQVLRSFLLKKVSQRSCKAYYHAYECVQHWFNVNTCKCTIMALPTRIYSLDVWLEWAKMEIRHESNSYYCSNRYKISTYIYPYYKLHPLLKRNGLSRTVLYKCKTNYIELMEFALSNPFIEKLIKLKQYSLISQYCWVPGFFTDEIFNLIRICTKHKYFISDGHHWIDLINNLKYFNKDIHNPYYICPKNLTEAHNYWMMKKRKVEAQKSFEERKKQMLKYDKTYRKTKSKYFNIIIQDKTLEIKPLKSVIEFFEEGIDMHHCVYDNGYFRKKNSLILSARNKKDNSRIETVEVDVKQFKIIQSRGKCNINSEYHERILQLVNQNMNKFNIKTTNYGN